MIPSTLHRLRKVLLALSLLCCLLALWQPHWPSQQNYYRLLFTVDITGSMNVRDYQYQDEPQSRLERSKQVMIDILQKLPCGSQVALSIFTERRSFLLLENVEVCQNYSPLIQSINMLNWRMAWEGDSHIARGLHSALELAQGLHSDLIFISDGQESPPLPYHGGPVYEAPDNAPYIPKGFILGAGARALSPIPKFNDQGHEIGFYEEDEVDQENRLGIPPSGSQDREGWHPRNAPFGASKAHGTEHLSSVKQSYLQELALDTALHYADLNDATSVLSLLPHKLHTQQQSSPLSTRPLWIGLALLWLTLYYLSGIPRRGFLNIKRKKGKVHSSGAD